MEAAAKTVKVEDSPSEMDEICRELGCTTKPGVALRFVKELRRDLHSAHERHVELLRSWDDASLTERQELDRLRRGWGPSTPTERMARRNDLVSCMHAFSTAMDAVVPDDKNEDELTLDHYQAAYDKLSEGYRACIELLHALPELKAPTLAVDGFTDEDFRIVADLMRSKIDDDAQFRAVMSNNHNTILAALYRAASAS